MSTPLDSALMAGRRLDRRREMDDITKDFEVVVNRHSAENTSNTPDFILAEYLYDCLVAFDIAIRKRTEWYKEA